jgi:Glycine-zipper domain
VNTPRPTATLYKEWNNNKYMTHWRVIFVYVCTFGRLPFRLLLTHVQHTANHATSIATKNTKSKLGVRSGGPPKGPLIGAFAGASTGALIGAFTGALIGAFAGASTDAFVGTWTGAITGAVTGAIAGAVTGALAGALTGVTGAFVGALTGALVGALTGAFAGALTGAFKWAFVGALTGALAGETYVHGLKGLPVSPPWIQSMNVVEAIQLLAS